MSNLPQGELCSVYSFAQGEDPIGSATPFKRCLLVELPTPWDRDVWSTSDTTKAIKKIAGMASRPGDAVRLLAFQPDPNPDPARVGLSRVFVYRRPESTDGFSTYAKREYLVPSGELLTVLPELLQEPAPDSLPAGVQELGGQTRDIFLCTHADRDVCCGRFGKELLETLQTSDQVRSQPDLRGCFEKGHGAGKGGSGVGFPYLTSGCTPAPPAIPYRGAPCHVNPTPVI